MSRACLVVCTFAVAPGCSRKYEPELAAISLYHRQVPTCTHPLPVVFQFSSPSLTLWLTVILCKTTHPTGTGACRLQRYNFQIITLFAGKYTVIKLGKWFSIHFNIGMDAINGGHRDIGLDSCCYTLLEHHIYLVGAAGVKLWRRTLAGISAEGRSL